MPYNKMESGMFKITCLPFPKFSNKKELLHGKSCHIIEPYDGGKLVSAFVKKDDGGFIIKTLDENGRHIGPKEVGPIDKDLTIAMNIAMLLKVSQFQLFFSIVENKTILVDVFDGKTFISPGMLNDVYGKRMNIQNTKSIEKFDSTKEYNSIIKPAIPLFEDNQPVYAKI